MVIAQAEFFHLQQRCIYKTLTAASEIPNLNLKDDSFPVLHMDHVHSALICIDDESKFNRKTGFYLSDITPGCGDDAELQDGKCVGNIKPTCKDGYTYSYDLASQTGQCCSPGMHWDGEACYSIPGTDGCPSDTTQGKDRCTKPSGGLAYCPPEFRESKGQCIGKGPFCPPMLNYELSLNACVEYEAPECLEPGSKLENGRCIWELTPECPKGSRQEGNYCVVIIKPYCDGEDKGKAHFDGTQCVSNVTPECEDPSANFDGEECLTGRKPVCNEANGFFLQVGRCVSTKTSECPDGGKLTAKGECVSKRKVKCKTGDLVGKDFVGYDPKNGECFSKHDKIRCDDGAEWDPKIQTCLGTKSKCEDGTSIPEGGECVSQEIPRCPDPERFEFNGKKYVLKKGPDCAPGFRLLKGECVSEIGPACGYGQVPKDGRCVLVSGDCMEFEFCPTYKPLRTVVIVEEINPAMGISDFVWDVGQRSAVKNRVATRCASDSGEKCYFSRAMVILVHGKFPGYVWDGVMLVLNGGEGVHCAEEEERGAEENLHDVNRV
ncbi:hypothetical protein BDV38DRAFT_283461 [Aspergillus pseudotamarii]|uniref:Uncharacterized protein n=1 Tax=Aspergillus pseudotamarii TaxID=132259 RepID=A0A5N6SVC6_ASPPS|nr:uncharacterized protein BDV38DRAFT_283461 [Aspergillus pseudotamarii]KAE8137074.1 hypothetical protein BDV38DRAFT_283461 [Aspergillus pseudotamarii]